MNLRSNVGVCESWIDNLATMNLGTHECREVDWFLIIEKPSEWKYTPELALYSNPLVRKKIHYLQDNAHSPMSKVL